MSVGAERPRLSVIIPLLSDTTALLSTLDNVLALRSTVEHMGMGELEVIVVDVDANARRGDALQRIGEVRLVRCRQRCTQSGAYQVGIAHATGTIVALIEADGSNRSDDLPMLLRALLAGADIVIGQPQAAKPRRQTVTDAFAAPGQLRAAGNGAALVGTCIGRRSALLAIFPLPDSGDFQQALRFRARRAGIQVAELIVSPAVRKEGQPGIAIGGVRFRALVLSTMLQQQPRLLLQAAHALSLAVMLIIGSSAVFAQRSVPLPAWTATTAGALLLLLGLQWFLLHRLLQRRFSLADTSPAAIAGPNTGTGSRRPWSSEPRRLD